jgi:CRISPR-associated protein Cas2
VTVIVVAACPVGLRGHLTRWLLEISAGVFVGKVSARVRDLLWVRTIEMVKSGRAIMVYSANNEQGLAFKVHRHEWIPVEVEGVTLMLRPAERPSTSPDPNAERTHGWSSASRRRRFRE